MQWGTHSRCREALTTETKTSLLHLCMTSTHSKYSHILGLHTLEILMHGGEGDLTGQKLQHVHCDEYSQKVLTSQALIKHSRDTNQILTVERKTSLVHLCIRSATFTMTVPGAGRDVIHVPSRRWICRIETFSRDAAQHVVRG